jgi:hypothetical protein
MKPLRDFIQLDAWADPEHMICDPDSLMGCGDDGDIITGSAAIREPQNSGTTVRIYIAAGTDRATAARLIRKQLEWLDRGVLEDMQAEVDRERGMADAGRVAGASLHIRRDSLDTADVDYPVDSDNVTRGVMPDDALDALFAATRPASGEDDPPFV